MNTWTSNFEIIGFVFVFIPLWGLKACINKVIPLKINIEDGLKIVPFDLPGRDSLANLADHIRPPPEVLREQ